MHTVSRRFIPGLWGGRLAAFLPLGRGQRPHHLAGGCRSRLCGGAGPVPCSAQDLGERWREAVLLEAKLCRATGEA